MKTNELQDDATVRQKLGADPRAHRRRARISRVSPQTTSEDPGSAVEGGDLGWTGPGSFVPEFEKVLDDAQGKRDQPAVPHPVRLAHRAAARPPPVRQHRRAQAPPRRGADPREPRGRGNGAVAAPPARRGLRRIQALEPRGQVARHGDSTNRADLRRACGHRAGPLPCDRARSARLRPRVPRGSRRCWPSARSSFRLPVTLQPTMTRARARPACRRGSLRVLHQPLAAASSPGPSSIRATRATCSRMLDRAIDGAMSGEFDAIVTAPVHKGIINDAGVPFTRPHRISRRAHRRAALPVMMLASRLDCASRWRPRTCRCEDVSAAITIDSLCQMLARSCIADLRTLVGHLRAAHRRVRAQSACGRRRPSGRRGNPRDRAGDRAHARARHPASAARCRRTPSSSRDCSPSCDVVLAMYHDQGLPVIKHAASTAPST